MAENTKKEPEFFKKSETKLGVWTQEGQEGFNRWQEFKDKVESGKLDEKFSLSKISDHIENNQNPHGPTLVQGKLEFFETDLDATPVAGRLEYSNDKLYLTNVGKQRAIDRTSDVITTTTSVSNTTTETTIFTGTIDANDLRAGNVIKGIVSGVVSNATASDDVTIRVKLGSTTLITLAPAIGNVTNADWHIDGIWTVRSVGATGSIATHVSAEISGNKEITNSIETVDTTAAENITVTIQWDNAKAGNIISAYIGLIEFKN